MFSAAIILRMTVITDTVEGMMVLMAAGLPDRRAELLRALYEQVIGAPRSAQVRSNLLPRLGASRDGRIGA